MLVPGNGTGSCTRKPLAWSPLEELSAILKRTITRKVRKIAVSTELREELEFIYKCGLFIYKCGFSRPTCSHRPKFSLFPV